MVGKRVRLTINFPSEEERNDFKYWFQYFGAYAYENYWSDKNILVSVPDHESGINSINVYEKEEKADE